MKKVICISGHAGAGKDTVASMMKNMLENRFESKVLVIHNADLLKFMCKSLFGWDGQKDKQGRTILQRVGTDVIRAQEPDFWVNFIVKVLTLFPDEWDYVLIPDVRFPNEIEKLKEAGFDVVHVQVTRPTENQLTDEQRSHPSETSMDGVIADKVIENDDGMIELCLKVLASINAWMNEWLCPAS